MGPNPNLDIWEQLVEVVALHYQETDGNQVQLQVREGWYDETSFATESNRTHISVGLDRGIGLEAPL